MIINNNIMALNTHRNYAASNDKNAKSSEKLSSGYRINRSADDASGLAISEKMRGQIRGLSRARYNVQDGISMIQTAEGAMAEISDILNRARELAVQSASDTNDGLDRAAIQFEVKELVAEIESISNTTEFNGIQLLNNTFKNESTVVGLDKILGGGQITTAGKLMDNFQTSSIPNFSTNTTGFKTTILTETFREYTPGSPVLQSSNTVTSKTYFTPDSVQGASTTGTDGMGPYTEYTVTTYSDINEKYAGAYMDFAGLGSDFALSDLYGEGFNSTCATCPNHYSIRFTDGTGISDSRDGANYILDIGIGNATDGASLVNIIMNALNSTPAMIGHYTQYVNDGSKLYLYDNRPSTVTSPSRIDTFTPVVHNGADIDPKDLIIQAGPNQGQEVPLKLPWVTAKKMGVSGLNVSTRELASAAIGRIDSAANYLAKERSRMGAYQNRLEYRARQAAINEENTTAAESRIRDVDMASEMMESVKSNIMSQAAQSALSQANQVPNNVLSLLK